MARGAGQALWRGSVAPVLVRRAARWRRSVARGSVTPDATKHSLLLEGVGRLEISLRRPTDLQSDFGLHSALPAHFAVRRELSGFWASRCRLSGGDDSCECSGDTPPTRSVSTPSGAIATRSPRRVPGSPGTRPTEGIYAAIISQSSTNNTRCCGILPTATTTSRHRAIIGGDPPEPGGRAGDTLWTVCGLFPRRRPDRRGNVPWISFGARLRPSNRNVRSILPH